MFLFAVSGMFPVPAVRADRPLPPPPQLPSPLLQRVPEVLRQD